VVDAVGGGHHEIAALRGKHVPAHRQVVVDGRVQHRHRLFDAVQHVAQEFEGFGEDDAVGAFVHAEAIGRVVLDDRFDVAGEFHQLGDGLLLLRLELGVVGALLDETLTAHDRPVDHRHVEVVLHDLLRGERAVVGIGHLLVEAVAELALDVDLATTADVVHPEGHVDEIRRAQGLQQAVEGVVPVLDLPLFAADERKPFEMPGQQVIAVPGLDDRGRDMRGEGDEFADRRIGREHAVLCGRYCERTANAGNRHRVGVQRVADGARPPDHIVCDGTTRPWNEAGSSRPGGLRRRDATPQTVQPLRDRPAFGFAGPVMRPEM